MWTGNDPEEEKRLAARNAFNSPGGGGSFWANNSIYGNVNDPNRSKESQDRLDAAQTSQNQWAKIQSSNPSSTLPSDPTHFDPQGNPYAALSYSRWLPTGQESSISDTFAPGMGPGQVRPDQYVDPFAWSNAGPLYQMTRGGQGVYLTKDQIPDWIIEQKRQEAAGMAVPNYNLPGGIQQQRFKPMALKSPEDWANIQKEHPGLYEPLSIPVPDFEPPEKLTPEQVQAQAMANPDYWRQIFPGAMGKEVGRGQTVAGQQATTGQPLEAGGGGGTSFGQSRGQVLPGQAGISPSPANFGVPAGQKTSAQTEPNLQDIINNVKTGQGKESTQTTQGIDPSGAGINLGSNKPDVRIIEGVPYQVLMDKDGRAKLVPLEFSKQDANGRFQRFQTADGQNWAFDTQTGETQKTDVNVPPTPPIDNWTHVTIADGSVVQYNKATGEQRPLSPVKELPIYQWRDDKGVMQDVTYSQYLSLKTDEERQLKADALKAKTTQDWQKYTDDLNKYRYDVAWNEHLFKYNAEKDRQARLRTERNDFQTMLDKAQSQGLQAGNQAIEAQKVRNEEQQNTITNQNNALVLALQQRKADLELAQTPFRALRNQTQTRFAPARQ